MSKKKYYDVLGVSEKASEAEIKAAYHKLALKWHPDRWVSKSESEKEQAEEKFKEINQVHSVLSDPEKRKNYDRYGTTEFFRKKNYQSWQPLNYFWGVSFPFAVILAVATLILNNEGINKFLWESRRSSRYHRDLMGSFCLLWLISFLVILSIYVFYFLFKALIGEISINFQKKTSTLIKKKERNNRKPRYYISKYLILLIIDKLFINLIIFQLLAEKSHLLVKLLLIIFPLIILNCFFLHYFFCVPIMKILCRKYPNYFPKYFSVHYQTRYYVRYWGSVKLKKPHWQKTEWPIMITAIFYMFQTFSLILYSKKLKS